MKKIIKIGTKEYEMQSSAFTSFKYRDETGRSLVKDLTDLGKKYQNIGEIKEEDMLSRFDELEDFINTTLRVAYIMCLEAKSVNCSFEDFLMQIDGYLQDMGWLSHVIELALSPLSRNVQTNQD